MPKAPDLHVRGDMKALEKDLRDKGYTIEREDSSKGTLVHVVAPDGQSQNWFHLGTWEKATAYGIFEDLKKMGYTRPEISRTPPPKDDKPKEGEDYSWYCKVTTCEHHKKPFRWKTHRNRHIQSAVDRGDEAHVAEYGAGVTAKATGQDITAMPERKERKPKGVKITRVEPESPVHRMKNKVEQLRKARQVENEAMDWILEQYEKQAEELGLLKTKYDKLVKKLEGLVDLV